MALIREETVQNYSDSELLQMVRETLEEMGLPYEEKPGGFGFDKLMAPGDGVLNEELFIGWTEMHTIETPAIDGIPYSSGKMQMEDCKGQPKGYRLTSNCLMAIAA